MKPEDAFSQIDAGEIRNRTVSLGTNPETEAPDEPGEAVEVTVQGFFLRFLGYFAAAVILAVVALLIVGGYLLSHRNTKETSTSSPPPTIPIAFTDEQIKALITDSLTRFLTCETTDERLRFVADPEREAPCLTDYYESRGNRDAGLKSINLIRPVLLDGLSLWVVSYTDSGDVRRNVTFQRAGNDFLLNWSSSYAYGELSWDDFASARPSEPVAMRAFLLRHEGEPPPGYSPQKWASYVVEDNSGHFTQLAVMERTAEGQSLIAESPPEANRLPVFIRMHFENGALGKQLVIDELIHFKWLGQSTLGKGTNSRRSGDPGSGVTSLGIDTVE